MNRVAAQLVVQPKGNKTVVTVADTVANNAKCSPPFAPNAERKPWYLSNQPVTSPSIAATVTNHFDAAIGNSLLKTSQAVELGKFLVESTNTQFKEPQILARARQEWEKTLQ